MKTLRPSIVLTLWFVILFGLGFPALVWAIGQAAFPRQANGSLLVRDGKPVGSVLIGQNFAGEKYFHPRPSAAGSGYDASNSSGTNLGPTNPKLLEGVEGFDGVKQLAVAYRKTNGLEPNTIIPADAVTRSASGLDPHISPANADLQAGRIARSRSMSLDDVKRAIARHTEEPFLGIFGERRVNVLLLNASLDKGQ